jgi:hypothetical protein
VSRGEAILIHSATVLVGLTGVALFWMKYLLVSSDPFAVIHHPLQPWALRLHILFAPLMLFGLGMILSSHVAAKLRSGLQEGRRSGLSLLWTLAPMTFSGYLIQVAVEETTRKLAVVVHVVASLLFLLAYLLHGWLAWRSTRSGVPASAESVARELVAGIGASTET